MATATMESWAHMNPVPINVTLRPAGGPRHGVPVAPGHGCPLTPWAATAATEALPLAQAAPAASAAAWPLPPSISIFVNPCEPIGLP